METEAGIEVDPQWMPEDGVGVTIELLSPIVQPLMPHWNPTVRHLPYCPICSPPTARNVTRIVQKLPSWEW